MNDKKCKQCGLCFDHNDFVKLRDWEGVDEATCKQVGTCKDCGIDISFEYRDFGDEKNNVYLDESVRDKENHDENCTNQEVYDIKLIRKDLDEIYEEFKCKNCNFKGSVGWQLIDSYPVSCDIMDNINGHPENAPCEECHVVCERVDAIMP